MKHYILFFFLFTFLNLMGQDESPFSMMGKKKNKKAFEYYNKIIGQNSKFEATTAPSKWIDEPVVILAQKYYLSVHSGNQYNYKGIVRKRILIQESAALEQFSEFYFQSSELFGIEITKADGNKIEVDFSKAVFVDQVVPDFYKDSYHTSTFYKIAIPNLQVGDILDYYKVFEYKSNDELEIITNLPDEYPIVHCEYEFDIYKKYYFFYRILNTDLNFIESQGGFNEKGDWKKSYQKYYLISEFSPIKSERWDYPLISAPALKIKLFYSNPNQYYNENSYLIKLIQSKLPRIRNNEYLLPEEIISRISNLKIIDEKEEEDRVHLVYRLIRNWFLKKMKEESSGSPFILSKYSKLRGELFARIFSRALTKVNVSNELIISCSRKLGDIDNVVTSDELEFIVHVTSLNKNYSTPDNYNIAGEIPPEILGSKGYISSFWELDQEEPKLKIIKIKNSSHKSNISHTKMSVKLLKNNTCSFNNLISYSGAYKSLYSPYIIAHTDYFFKECLFFSDVKEKKYLEELIQTKMFQNYIEGEKEIIESRDKWVIGDFNTDKIKDYELIKYGNVKEDPYLSFKYTFETDSYISKGGTNLILEIGKLIQDQVELSKKEKVSRTETIQFNFAKTIVNDIEVELPNGLIAQGLDALNVNVDNTNGAFKSSAVQEGNMLKVKTKKIYKKQTVAAENWLDLVEMLEAAYDFSQKKIILKKN